MSLDVISASGADQRIADIMTSDYSKLSYPRPTFPCPECSGELILCRGEKRAAYLRHKHREGFLRKCGGEAIEHLVAKELLKEYLNCDDHAKTVTFRKTCSHNACQLSPNLQDIHFECEVRLVGDNNAKTSIFDVAGLCSRDLVFGIEILHTHKTREDVPQMRDGYPWVEVSAEEVLSQLMGKGDITKRLSLVDFRDCEECRESKIKSLDIIKIAAETLGLRLSRDIYEALDVSSLKTLHMAMRGYYFAPFEQWVLPHKVSRGRAFSEVRKGPSHRGRIDKRIKMSLLQQIRDIGLCVRCNKPKEGKTLYHVYCKSCYGCICDEDNGESLPEEEQSAVSIYQKMQPYRKIRVADIEKEKARRELSWLDNVPSSTIPPSARWPKMYVEPCMFCGRYAGGEQNINKDDQFTWWFGQYKKICVYCFQEASKNAGHPARR